MIPSKVQQAAAFYRDRVLRRNFSRTGWATRQTRTCTGNRIVLFYVNRARVSLLLRLTAAGGGRGSQLGHHAKLDRTGRVLHGLYGRRAPAFTEDGKRFIPVLSPGGERSPGRAALPRPIANRTHPACTARAPQNGTGLHKKQRFPMALTSLGSAVF